MNRLNMAIIGHGFVGKALDYGFNSPLVTKYIIDPIYGTKIESLKDKDIDITFVCVPTPMGLDGTIDATNIDDSICYLLNNVKGLIVVKSTITPDIAYSLGDQVVYNPEFLTEKSANEDFVNPIMHVFGGDFEKTKQVEQIYQQYSSCKPCPVFHMSREDASFVKYGINSYLSSKVLWFNQFYDLINKYGGNFGKVVSAMTSDKRVGTSHTTVPGFDGKRGFSGACLPKDAYAFAKFAQQEDSPFTVLEEVIRRNQDYRNQSGLTDREKQQNIRFDLDI